MVRFITTADFTGKFGRRPAACTECYYDDAPEKCAEANCGGGIFYDIPAAHEEPVVELKRSSDFEVETEEIQEPNRYKWRGTESLPFCIKNNLNTVQNNVLKYLYRYPKKGERQALEKACVYLRKGIEFKQKRNLVTYEVTEKFVVENKFTWREALVLFNLLGGDYKFALEHLEKLIKEVYGTTQEG